MYKRSRQKMLGIPASSLELTFTTHLRGPGVINDNSMTLATYQ